MTDNTLIGRTFDNRYKLTDRLGVGGMAEVYRAQDMVLGRTVAVKVMLPQFASDEAFAERFRQEAASAANLQSPYIVNIYDWGQDNGTYYIVMEYVRGSDLKTGIKQRGALNQRKVAEIGVQVCQALSVAHNMDIIHRDIKPQNIMVQPDGNVKVMDFGIARAKNSERSKTATVLGTAHYISPEQAQGKELTAASDIYSLGIVLYEAVTGKLPFDGPDAISVAMKQVSEQPVPPRQIVPNIHPALESIICTAMAKNPNDRFATASDMRRALKDFLSGGPNMVATSVISGAAGAVAGAAASRMGNVPSNDSTQVMQVPSGMKQIDPATKVQSYRNDAPAGDKKKSAGKKGIIIAIVIAAVLVIAGIVGFTMFGSQGAEEVPEVVGMTTDAAKIKIEAAGFSVGSTSKVYDDKIPEGCVVSQDPAAGAKKDKGAKINLVISQGVEKVTVPDLTGMTANEASTALSKAGLKPVPGEATYSAKVEVNHIVSQNPVPGETVPKNSEVVYVLSLGTESIEIPDVTYLSEKEATAKLNNSGFEVAVDRSQYSDNVTKGYVIYQDPSSGAKLDRGSTVTIYVSAGEDPSKKEVDVPNVVGQTVANAVAILGSNGIYVDGVSGDQDDAAIVIAQSITGKTQSPAHVTLTAKKSTAPLSGGTPTP